MNCPKGLKQGLSTALIVSFSVVALPRPGYSDIPSETNRASWAKAPLPQELVDHYQNLNTPVMPQWSADSNNSCNLYVETIQVRAPLDHEERELKWGLRFGGVWTSVVIGAGVGATLGAAVPGIGNLLGVGSGAVAGLFGAAVWGASGGFLADTLMTRAGGPQRSLQDDRRDRIACIESYKRNGAEAIVTAYPDQNPSIYTGAAFDRREPASTSAPIVAPAASENGGPGSHPASS